MLISILMANYNNGQFIEEAIDSVLLQTYSNWELIIVDDFSTDNSKEILQKRISGQIKVFYNQENKGCGFTKRKAAELARGDYMIFLDPDDTLAPNAVLELLKIHQDNADCAIAYATHYICDEKLNIIKISTYPGQVAKGDTQLAIDSKKVTAPALFKKINYFTTEGINMFLEKAIDQDLYAKLEETGRVIFVDKPLYYYRQHPGGISQSHFANIKAQYWNTKIVEDTYRRRKITPSPFARNLTRNELNTIRYFYHQREIHSGIAEKKYKKIFKHMLDCFVLLNKKTLPSFLSTIRFTCLNLFSRKDKLQSLC